MTSDLVAHLTAAIEAGAVPSPVAGEAMDSYRLRVAHAGAVVGAGWFAERQRELAAAAASLTGDGHLRAVPEPDDEDEPSVERSDG